MNAPDRSFEYVAPNVLVVRDSIAIVDRRDIELVKRLAAENSRGIARICAHPTAADTLHEMIVALAKQRYIRPHKHPGKSESFHVIEGRVSIALFGDDGILAKVVNLSADADGGGLFYRMSQPIFHTVIPSTLPVVYHETTNGPFDPADTVYAPWAPSEEDETRAARWSENLAAQMRDASREDRR